jgi:hypothetical protein
LADISLNIDPTLVNEPGYADLLFVDGTLVLTQDADSRGSDPVTQQIIQKLNFFLGEWFLDLNDGTPWFQQILTRSATQDLIDSILQERILSAPGVAVLRQYASTVDRSARILSVSFTIQTQAGVVAAATVPLPLAIGSK